MPTDSKTPESRNRPRSARPVGARQGASLLAPKHGAEATGQGLASLTDAAIDMQVRETFAGLPAQLLRSSALGLDVAASTPQMRAALRAGAIFAESAYEVSGAEEGPDAASRREAAQGRAAAGPSARTHPRGRPISARDKQLARVYSSEVPGAAPSRALSRQQGG